MKKRYQQNNVRRRILRPILPALLSVLLLLGVIGICAGTTYARYRSERDQKLLFQVREPDQIVMGTFVQEVFVPVDQETNPLTWSMTNAAEPVACLHFAAANGIPEEEPSVGTQRIRLCMVGSLGLWNQEALSEEAALPKVSVTFATGRGNEEKKTVEATVSPIVKGTALYNTYGEGWIYSFYETTAEGTRELSWELSGGEWSCVRLEIQAEGTEPQYISRLQPMVWAEPAGT